jgi:hypothetical protein
LVAGTIDWPGSDEIFPEFWALLRALLSTSVVFFLLLPLANWPLPRRVLRRAFEAEVERSAPARCGWWLMWPAVLIFTGCAFFPGAGAAMAWPALPEDAVFWRGATGSGAVVCWLLAIITVWLAAVLASAGRAGQILSRQRSTRWSQFPPQVNGLLIAAVVQLTLYPFLTAVACGTLVDLVCGSETFVPAGMIVGAGRASTGGGPAQVWLWWSTLAAWPTLVACAVPVLGLGAGLLVREPTRDAAPADEPPEVSTAATSQDANAAPGHNDRERAWSLRALLLAACCFLMGITALAVTVRYRSGDQWPRLAGIGWEWWAVLAVALLGMVWAICLQRLARQVRSGDRAAPRGWIVGSVLVALVCGSLATWQSWSLAVRGLVPGRVEQTIYPRADLAYASAVRVRVLDLFVDLRTREANRGALAPDEQTLRDLCDRLHKKLVVPTENAAVEADDPSPIAAMAAVVAARQDRPPDNVVFDGNEAELVSLIRDIRRHAARLQLPTVLGGGRSWAGVHCLFTLVIVTYLAVLAVALLIVAAAGRGGAAAEALAGFVPFWTLGAVFAGVWVLVC